MRQYQQYATMTQGREVLHGALWDTLTYVSGTTTLLNFFQQTMAALTADVTNMLNAGMLPYPTQFLVRAIRMFIKQRPESQLMAATTTAQNGAISAVQLLINTGVLNIRHGSKEYGPFPLRVITAGNGPVGPIAVGDVGAGAPLDASGVDYAQNGMPHSKNVYTLGQPLLIETSMNFVYSLSWPAGAVTIVRDTPICLCLEGDLVRQVQ